MLLLATAQRFDLGPMAVFSVCEDHCATLILAVRGPESINANELYFEWSFDRNTASQVVITLGNSQPEQVWMGLQLTATLSFDTVDWHLP